MSGTVTIGGRGFRDVNSSRPRNDAAAPAIVSSKKKRNKYNAQAVVVDGVRFASKAEAERDAELVLLERAGKIRNLKRQPKYRLEVAGVHVCTYIGDWSYDEDLGPHWNTGIRAAQWQPVCEDRKGFLTPLFKLKFKLVKALHPEIEWRLS